MSSESQSTRAIEVFYSYSHKDEELRNQLENHLAMLRRDGIIKGWHDRRISAGQEWDGKIDEHLNSAQVILLLVSADFLASNYCYDIEVKLAMERHDSGDACVIPIILRPCDWQKASFGKVHALPKDANPVTLWADRDEAFLDVAKGIRNTVEERGSQNRASTSVETEVESVSTKAEITKPAQRLNIPRPPLIGFVARRDEQGRDIVERLKSDLAPQANQPITLSGPGGVGKTTLAAEAARALEEEFVDRIVWSRAEGRADFTLSTLLDDIVTQLGRADLRPLALEAKAAQVHALLSNPPALVVLDNYETISDEGKSLIEEWLAQAQCSALITSRHRINTTRNINIAAMSREEAQEFLEKVVAQAQDAQMFSPTIRQRIYETAEANPFVMQWVVGQIDSAQEPEMVLEELKQGEGDAAQKVFDRSYNLPQLGDDGRAALLALSLFAPSASRAALASVAGFDDSKRVNEAVKNLHALWLIKGIDENRRFTIEGLTRSLALARLSKDARATEFRQRVVEHFHNYAQEHEQTTGEDFAALEMEKDNLLNAIDTAFEMKYWESVNQIADVLGHINGFLDVRGYWDEAIRCNQRAVEAAAFTNNKHTAAVHSHRIGIIQYRRGLYDESRKASEDALATYRNLKSEINIAAALHQLAIIAQAQGEIEEARQRYDESLKIAKKLDNQIGIANTLHQLGRLAQAQGEIEEARRLYDESLKIAKKLNDKRGIANTLHQLGTLAQDQGEIEEARRLYDESLEIEKELGNQIGIAISLHALAILVSSQGELREARRLYEESLAITEKLGDKSNLALIFYNLGLLEEREGNKAEARRLWREALSIFERLGSPDAEMVQQALESLDGESS